MAKEAEKTTKRMVKVHLFKDNKDYKDDVFVCINGKSYAVKRGVDVEVPEAVAKVLEASQIQDGKAADLMAKAQDEFKENADKH